MALSDKELKYDSCVDSARTGPNTVYPMDLSQAEAQETARLGHGVLKKKKRKRGTLI